jgi:hypothetical protein
LLRSQAGVGEVVEPYPNLRKGQIVVNPDNKDPLDLPALVGLLENEVGFSPVTEVELRVRGRITKHDGQLAIEVSETGQSFEVGEQPKEKTLVQGQIIDARGKLAGLLAGKRLDLVEWGPAPPPASQP